MNILKVAADGLRRIPLVTRIASALRGRTAIRGIERLPCRGMWVIYGDAVGILTNIEPGDVATVMLVDDKGLNRLEVHVPARELRQAYLAEIPADRRPERVAAVGMGYT